MKAKRKLSDLKENERICVENEKQAKGLRRLLRKQGYSHGVSSESTLDIDFVRTNCHHIKISDKNYYYQQSDFDKSYPASDFIKPKKSKSNRIKKLEKQVKEIQQSLASKPSEIEVNNPENVSDVSKKELTDFEVGKWYKCSDPDFNKFMVFATQFSHSNINFKGYGFNAEGDFSNPDGFSWGTDRIYLASKEEVEQALIAEAERRGFKEGSRFKKLNKSKTIVDFCKNGNLKYSEDVNTLYIDEGEGEGYNVFYNGIWAEIIEQPKQEEIDWSVPRLVKAKTGDTIIMTSGLGSTENYISLTGIVLESDLWHKGRFSTTWNASEFEIYKGSICLHNE
jgi:hypothetical protein